MPRLAPLLTISVPPDRASVPLPVTAPAIDEPFPDKVSVSPEAIVSAVLAPSVRAPEMVTDPDTPASAVPSRTKPDPKLAPESKVSVPPDSASLPAPLVAPAKLVVPVRVSLSPDAIVRVVPAPAENAPA